MTMANRVVYGALPGGGMGLRVSRPGYNVLDAGLEPRRVAFDSRWPASMRLRETGSGTVQFLARKSFSGTYSTPPFLLVATWAFGDRFSMIFPTSVTKDSFSLAGDGVVNGTVYNYWVFTL